MRKIAIVGSAPGSRDLAPYDDPSWELWGLNFFYNYMKRWDLIFDLHSPLIWTPQHFERLKLVQEPVYTIQPNPELPTSKPYPIREIIAHFGTYFTNSISYMLALAIMEQPDEIGLWGVDMAVTPEYISQRPSCEFFVGWARGSGIPVYIPPQADLCKCTSLYGFGVSTGDKQNKYKTRKQELETRMANIQQTIKDIDTKTQEIINEKLIEQAAIVGALEQMGYESQWRTDEENTI